MVREYIYILAVFVGIGILSSCQDEPIMQGSGHIPEGNATISASVSYKPFGSMLGDDSRAATAGDAIKNIETLYVLLYDEGGKLVTMFNAEEEAEDYKEETHPYTISDEVKPEEEHIAESSGKGATFRKVVPYGKYKIYAVANVDLSNNQYSESIQTESGLKSIRFGWNDSVGKNNQMFGFFSAETSNDDVSKPAGFDAPVVTIASPSVSLHAWIRRLASKVTIAYDGTNLNENVYIYIHSVQIIDIPKQCLLGSVNTPNAKDQLLPGASIGYRTSAQGNLNTAGITITKGNPKDGSDHAETSGALFFYENMQGTTEKPKGKFQDESGNGTTVTHPDGNNPDDPDYKDGVPYGSYIEVKGYYVNKIAGKASQGEIIYRFMLGKDAKTDCNAERNYHYKLTLKFKNDANNPDWHIVYEPENPTISVPTPLYISYGYNESIHIPVIVRGASVDANTTIKATITKNPWGYPNHKYYNKSNHDGLEDGFLIFANPKSAIKITESIRNEEWPKDGFGHWNAVKPTDVDGTVARYDIPVYTRPLILSNSLTGHNPYVSQERKAKVKFEVTLDGKTYNKEIEVIQVKRLVNPTGVWRSADKDTPFNVRLMELNEPDTDGNGMVNTDFHPTISDGPWTAHIEKGSSWVRIAETGSNDWGTEDVVGETGSEIRFDYKPEGVNNTSNVRCGVIKITYHNNNCVHYVFVSQGNGTINLEGAEWQNRNILAQNQLVANPLLEGSMFKFGNPWHGILVENNYQSGYGFNQNCWGMKFLTTSNPNPGVRFDSSDGIGFNLNGFTDDRKIYGDSAEPASYSQWKALEELPRRYGVLYGDECSETMTTTNDAYSYWQVGQERGMQGMFVWDTTNGNHVFFPIGSTGYGHRKVNDNAYEDVYGTIDKYSLLKYAQRPLEMPEATAKAVPMYYDIWYRKGAVYWYNRMYENTVDNDGLVSDGYAHDINYHSMVLQTYGKNPVGQADKDNHKSTDACFVRCVEK